MKCRHCRNELEHVFIDLGFSPPSNAYLSIDDLNKGERYLPLKIFVCDQCWLAQTKDYAKQDTFFGSDYAYFSSFSNSWLEHVEQYVEMITELLQLRENSLVVEIAANDGYLLKNFVKKNFIYIRYHVVIIIKLDAFQSIFYIIIMQFACRKNIIRI